MYPACSFYYGRWDGLISGGGDKICDNNVKFRSKGDMVTIEYDASAGRVKFAVNDESAGSCDVPQGTMFHPFVNVDDTGDAFEFVSAQRGGVTIPGGSAGGGGRVVGGITLEGGLDLQSPETATAAGKFTLRDDSTLVDALHGDISWLLPPGSAASAASAAVAELPQPTKRALQLSTSLTKGRHIFAVRVTLGPVGSSMGGSIIVGVCSDSTIVRGVQDDNKQGEELWRFDADDLVSSSSDVESTDSAFVSGDVINLDLDLDSGQIIVQRNKGSQNEACFTRKGLPRGGLRFAVATSAPDASFEIVAASPFVHTLRVGVEVDTDSGPKRVAYLEDGRVDTAKIATLSATLLDPNATDSNSPAGSRNAVLNTRTITLSNSAASKLGLEVTKGMSSTDPLCVTALAPDGQAAATGQLSIGDFVTHINSVDVQAMCMSQIQRLMQSASVQLTLIDSNERWLWSLSMEEAEARLAEEPTGTFLIRGGDARNTPFVVSVVESTVVPGTGSGPKKTTKRVATLLGNRNTGWAPCTADVKSSGGRLSDDGLTASGDTGMRAIISTTGVEAGGKAVFNLKPNHTDGGGYWHHVGCATGSDGSQKLRERPQSACFCFVTGELFSAGSANGVSRDLSSIRYDQCGDPFQMEIYRPAGNAPATLTVITKSGDRFVVASDINIPVHETLYLATAHNGSPLNLTIDSVELWAPRALRTTQGGGLPQGGARVAAPQATKSPAKVTGPHMDDVTYLPLGERSSKKCYRRVHGLDSEDELSEDEVGRFFNARAEKLYRQANGFDSDASLDSDTMDMEDFVIRHNFRRKRGLAADVDIDDNEVEKFADTLNVLEQYGMDSDADVSEAELQAMCEAVGESWGSGTDDSGSGSESDDSDSLNSNEDEDGDSDTDLDDDDTLDDSDDVDDDAGTGASTGRCPGSGQRCSGGPLRKYRMEGLSFRCNCGGDDCFGDIDAGDVGYGCRRCDYDECSTCFKPSHNGASPRAAMMRRGAQSNAASGADFADSGNGGPTTVRHTIKHVPIVRVGDGLGLGSKDANPAANLAEIVHRLKQISKEKMIATPHLKPVIRRKRPQVFSDVKKSSHFTLSDDRLKVTGKKSDEKDMLVFEPAMSSGVHSVSFKLKRGTKKDGESLGCCYYVGACTEGHSKFDAISPNGTSFWGVEDDNAGSWKLDKEVNGRAYRIGDVITLEADFNKGKFTVRRHDAGDGKPGGVVVVDMPAPSIHFCIVLYNDNARATIVDNPDGPVRRAGGGVGTMAGGDPIGDAATPILSKIKPYSTALPNPKWTTKANENRGRCIADWLQLEHTAKPELLCGTAFDIVAEDNDITLFSLMPFTAKKACTIVVYVSQGAASKTFAEKALWSKCGEHEVTATDTDVLVELVEPVFIPKGSTVGLVIFCDQGEANIKVTRGHEEMVGDEFLKVERGCLVTGMDDRTWPSFDGQTGVPFNIGLGYTVGDETQGVAGSLTSTHLYQGQDDCEDRVYCGKDIGTAAYKDGLHRFCTLHLKGKCSCTGRCGPDHGCQCASCYDLSFPVQARSEDRKSLVSTTFPALKEADSVGCHFCPESLFLTWYINRTPSARVKLHTGTVAAAIRPYVSSATAGDSVEIAASPELPTNLTFAVTVRAELLSASSAESDMLGPASDDAGYIDGTLEVVTACKSASPLTLKHSSSSGTRTIHLGPGTFFAAPQPQHLLQNALFQGFSVHRGRVSWGVLLPTAIGGRRLFSSLAGSDAKDTTPVDGFGVASSTNRHPGFLVLAGGRSERKQGVPSYELFNLASGKMQSGSRLPIRSAAMASVDGDVYLCGGLNLKQSPTRMLLRLKTSRWTDNIREGDPILKPHFVRASMHQGRCAHALVSIQHPQDEDTQVLVAIGGRGVATKGSSSTKGLRSTEALMVHGGDPAEKWRHLPSLLQGRQDFCAAVHQTGLYVFGGTALNEATKRLDFLDSVEFLDQKLLVDDAVAAGTTWSSVASSLPSPTACAAAVALGGYIYVVGGQNRQREPQASTFRFNPATGTWASLPPLKYARRGHAAFVVDGVMCVMGGRGANKWNWCPAEVYDTVQQEWSVVDAWSLHKTGFGVRTVSVSAAASASPAVGNLGSARSTTFPPPGFPARDVNPEASICNISYAVDVEAPAAQPPTSTCSGASDFWVTNKELLKIQQELDVAEALVFTKTSVNRINALVFSAVQEALEFTPLTSTSAADYAVVRTPLITAASHCAVATVTAKGNGDAASRDEGSLVATESAIQATLSKLAKQRRSAAGSLTATSTSVVNEGKVALAVRRTGGVALDTAAATMLAEYLGSVVEDILRALSDAIEEQEFDSTGGNDAPYPVAMPSRSAAIEARVKKARAAHQNTEKLYQLGKHGKNRETLKGRVKAALGKLLLAEGQLAFLQARRPAEDELSRGIAKAGHQRHDIYGNSDDDTNTAAVACLEIASEVQELVNSACEEFLASEGSDVKPNWDVLSSRESNLVWILPAEFMTATGFSDEPVVVRLHRHCVAKLETDHGALRKVASAARKLQSMAPSLVSETGRLFCRPYFVHRWRLEGVPLAQWTARGDSAQIDLVPSDAKGPCLVIGNRGTDDALFYHPVSAIANMRVDPENPVQALWDCGRNAQSECRFIFSDESASTRFLSIWEDSKSATASTSEAGDFQAHANLNMDRFCRASIRSTFSRSQKALAKITAALLRVCRFGLEASAGRRSVLAHLHQDAPKRGVLELLAALVKLPENSKQAAKLLCRLVDCGVLGFQDLPPGNAWGIRRSLLSGSMTCKLVERMQASVRRGRVQQHYEGIKALYEGGFLDDDERRNMIRELVKSDSSGSGGGMQLSQALEDLKRELRNRAKAKRESAKAEQRDARTKLAKEIFKRDRTWQMAKTFGFLDDHVIEYCFLKAMLESTVGLQQVVRWCEKELNDAFHRTLMGEPKTPSRHVLMIGDFGTGKSTSAYLIARVASLLSKRGKRPSGQEFNRDQPFDVKCLDSQDETFVPNNLFNKSPQTASSMRKLLKDLAKDKNAIKKDMVYLVKLRQGDTVQKPYPSDEQEGGWLQELEKRNSFAIVAGEKGMVDEYAQLPSLKRRAPHSLELSTLSIENVAELVLREIKHSGYILIKRPDRPEEADAAVMSDILRLKVDDKMIKRDNAHLIKVLVDQAISHKNDHVATDLTLGALARSMMLSYEDFEVEVIGREQLAENRLKAQTEVDRQIGWGGPEVIYGEDNAGATKYSPKHFFDLTRSRLGKNSGGMLGSSVQKSEWPGNMW